MLINRTPGGRQSIKYVSILQMLTVKNSMTRRAAGWCRLAAATTTIDGQLFFVLQLADAQVPLTAVLNWQAELKDNVPAD